MDPLRFISRAVLLPVLSLTVAASSTLAAPRNSAAQAAGSQALPRVQGPVEDSVRAVLGGNVHPLVRAGLDQGAVEDSLPAGRMLLLLARSPEQEAALREFIASAHTPGSPSFHQWLSPEEFGRRFGPADSDVAAVAAWLESHGLSIQKIHAGRLAIEFSGTAGQVREAFQTEIHRYLVNGEAHLANAADPAIPAALAPVIAGLAPINDFHPQSHLKVLGQAEFNPRTHQTTPQWTYPEWTYPAAGGVSYVVAPGDFATQYDINSVYKAGINGAGQSIAIVSASNVDLSLVQAYQTLFGLTANLPQVVVDGEDPGQNSAATEAYLDIELAGSVAPGARVVLYTSGGTALTDGLSLAAMRAVEDDLAGVISVSYGECEMELGQSGNAFWSALWQQAAAQGQTVFVSAGDGGSAGCDNFDAQQFAYGGLQVNGIAATPYDVAVGGTDFYFSQYAGSASAVSTQLAGYWSSTTTSPAVSLKQAVPEQAWNDFFGFNLVDDGNPSNLSSQTIVAGGGGASSAALYPSGSTGQGYPKPAWQTGSGVPADKVRDLPDVSLFAANGYNFSFYPICANPGDCSSTNLNSSGAVVITGVGGTSASSPAMAGIQALVNQNAGSWQGQADFIYYPLAAKQPAVFRDVTMGGNQVLCYPSTANCVQGKSGTTASGFNVESGYTAGAGYDQATGLGSVDVANLIKYWSTVTLTPTTTTLSVSPSSFVHGKTTVVSGTVAAAKGTPTGSVSLTGNDGITHYAGIDALALASGSMYAQVDNLPGGTYQLTAVYGGDGTFATSKSAPVVVTVTPENNTLAAAGWAWNPYDLNLYPLSSGITVPYGAQILLDAEPVSGNATIAAQATPATGTVTFTDKLGAVTTTSTQPLNAGGVAEWSTGVFAPGSHTISASYSGDASYNASSTAGAASFTVIQGSTSLTVKPLVSSVAAGASVAVDVQLATGYLPLYGTLPTGAVTVTLGGKSATAAWAAFGTTGNANLEAVVTFSNVAAGVLPLTASYAGDTNWLGSAANGGTVIALASKVTPTVALTSSLASPAPGQTFTLTATVTGPSGKATPTGTVTFLSDDQGFSATAALVKGTATLSVPGYSAANGTNVFTAVYQGDANYNSAASNAVNIAVAQSDFSLTTQTAELAIVPAKTGTSTLALAPVNGFSGSVTLTSSAPSGITATPAASSLALSALATDVVTLSVSASVAPPGEPGCHGRRPRAHRADPGRGPGARAAGLRSSGRNLHFVAAGHTDRSRSRCADLLHHERNHTDHGIHQVHRHPHGFRFRDHPGHCGCHRLFEQRRLYSGLRHHPARSHTDLQPGGWDLLDRANRHHRRHYTRRSDLLHHQRNYPDYGLHQVHRGDHCFGDGDHSGHRNRHRLHQQPD
ncbi:MAG: Ig-like domain repeat protein, partial [Terracidiphilus sp.]